MQQDDSARDRHVGGAVVARPTSCWKVSPAQYTEIEIKLKRLSHVLPRDFVLPSRHTLSRFLEGCIKGLNEHLPYIHLPTFSVTTAAPDLLLAMASIGAEFRFEAHLGIGLFYAAKAMVMHQLQQQSDGSAVGVLPQFPANTERALMDRDNQLQTMQAILGLMVQGS